VSNYFHYLGHVEIGKKLCTVIFIRIKSWIMQEQEQKKNQLFQKAHVKNWNQCRREF